ncbi:hypothetical protein [Lactobacillus ultunensis]|uniref:Uncharacterized protein n=1 Tax=Lactobacillus ultunensis DSM 16047 TaxID=525365 RepID=C2EMS1_9LACO|nr:hypothetical protein [Lactobacillus ultunensis]EEJ72280.1 hypothetical protein HMPREF0548_0967 [Lactobacillus ultunensis DSM 16047]
MEFRIDSCIPDVETIMNLDEAVANFDLNGQKPEDVDVERMPKND